MIEPGATTQAGKVLAKLRASSGPMPAIAIAASLDIKLKFVTRALVELRDRGFADSAPYGMRNVWRAL